MIQTRCNVIKGLPNIGNTCFFNVMLQSLLSLDSLRGYMLGPDLWEGPLALSFKQLFVETSASYNARSLLSPERLFRIICNKWPKFKLGSMEDSSELMSCLLNGLHAEETEAQFLSMEVFNDGNVTTMVDSIFRGQECSSISSTECSHISTRPQGFLVLPLSIPQRMLDGESVSIEDCLALYTEEVLLPEWHCEDCTTAKSTASQTQHAAVTTNNVKDRKEEDKEINAGGDQERDSQKKTKKDEKKVYRAATKTSVITRAPDVLVITLSRYKRHSNGDLEKLEGHVRFNEMLDMSLYMDQRSNKTDNSTYRLVSVAQHIGYINGGHYIVYVRASKMDDRQQQSRDSKSWFCASDEKIREASLQEALDSEAYILVYEKCSTDAFLAAANVTGEKSQLTNTAMLPQAGAPVFDRIPTPLDEFGPWESQKNRKRDKKREEELNLAKEDYEVAMKIWVFLDSFTLFGDNMPYYRFQLMTMVERGLGSRELNIPYSHLLSHSNSKELAMDVCNGYDRLRLQLTETAREYMQKLMPGLNVTESARKLMQQLELKILEMPKVHKKMKQCLGTGLLRGTKVYGHDADPIMIPLPEKCALVQDLMAHVISKHRDGYSWDGDFDINDMDVYDGKVVITKSPKLFEIQPQISLEFITAMGKDFLKIDATVLKKFTRPKTYVPYLKPFRHLLSGMGKYSEWWSEKGKAEGLREWILNFPFLKPSMARSNLLSGIYTACKAYDQGDDTALFKEIVTMESVSYWTNLLLRTSSRVLLDVFHYKDPARDCLYYQLELEFLFEYLRHLAHHGFHSSFEYRPLARRGDGPRVQLMQSLDELELSGAYRLEFAVVQALICLIESGAMEERMMFSVWDCYRKCNHSYRE